MNSHQLQLIKSLEESLRIIESFPALLPVEHLKNSIALLSSENHFKYSSSLFSDFTKINSFISEEFVDSVIFDELGETLTIDRALLRNLVIASLFKIQTKLRREHE